MDMNILLNSKQRNKAMLKKICGEEYDLKRAIVAYVHKETGELYKMEQIILSGRGFEIIINPEMTNEEIEIGKNNGKIQCIKWVRNRTGLGLKDSKDLVEKVFRENGWIFKPW
jgi:ribosomal protein L7/L12